MKYSREDYPENISRRNQVLHTFKMPWKFRISFFGILLSTGIVAFSRRQFHEVVQSNLMTPEQCLIVDMTGSIVSAVLFSLFAQFVYRNPVWSRSLTQIMWRYLLIAVIHIASFICLSLALRIVCFDLFGFSAVQITNWTDLIKTEVLPQIFLIVVTAATIHGLLFFQFSTFEQLNLMKTEQMLVEERLRSLQNQLNPHFLFNTLNTISAMMYRDVEAADRMIERLSELLRASLKLKGSQEVTLEEELKLLKSYSILMRERFVDAFCVEFQIDPKLNQLMLPPLLLQPLLENSFKHSRYNQDDWQRSKQSEIIVSTGTEAGYLYIKVSDLNSAVEGKEPSSTVHTITDHTITDSFPSEGVGLKVTRDRLKLLYGHQAELRTGIKSDGSGYMSEVRIALEVMRTKRDRSDIL